MYKICVALFAVLAVAAAKPSLAFSSYPYGGVASYPASYSAYPAPYPAPAAVYPAQPVIAQAAYPASYTTYAAAAAPLQAYTTFPGYQAFSGYSTPLNYGELPYWKKK